MGKAKEEKIEKLRKYVISIYGILLPVVVSIVGIVSYFGKPVDWLIWYVVIFVLIHISWGIINLLQKNTVSESRLPYYFTFLIAYLFPGVLALWQAHVFAVLMLYLLLPLLPMALYYSSKYVIYGIIKAVLVVAAILAVSVEVQILRLDYIKSDVVYMLNLIIIVSTLFFAVLFFYCHYKILKIMQDEGGSPVESEKETEEIEDKQWKKELYDKVITYFETKQPYKQPQYSLSMCASDLNTNTKYLSDAINAHYGTFDNLLNKYRLEFVKKMLDEHLADKYTIEYIYTLAGYSSRSTFYKNFYKTFKTTPLEYQEMLKS
jgi:AraC-like DNA-binding protein